MRISGVRSKFVLGLDLGQRQDHTAIVALERIEIVYDQREPVTYNFIRELRYRLRGIERVPLGTPYTDVVGRVRSRIAMARAEERPTLVVDATGVGAPVVELLRAARLDCRIVPVTITGGARETSHGSLYGVPRRDLIVGLQAVIEQRRLEICSDSPHAQALVQELLRFGAGQGSHDDLVLASALAWWWMRKGSPAKCWSTAA